MPLTVNMFYFCDPDGHTEYVQSQEECPVDYRTPRVGSITIKDVECTGVDASFVCAVGLPEAPVEKISLENINVSYLEEDKRIPQRPVMMDGFPEMSGRSIYLKNVNELEIPKIEEDFKCNFKSMTQVYKKQKELIQCFPFSDL